MPTYISTTLTSSLLNAVLEGFSDGILIATDKGRCIHANQRAHEICDQLIDGDVPSDRIPQIVWHLCQILIESSGAHPEQTVILEDEITIKESLTYRMRVQWLPVEMAQPPCILVTLENRQQSLEGLAIAEKKRFGLTPREADVWMRYRANYSYKEIAAELFITLNTVKKHMKNIHAKRQLALVSDA